MNPNVLISSAGRRVGLLQCFRQSLEGRGKIVTADLSSTAPAPQFADRSTLVPRCTAPEFIPEILALCHREAVALVVPTIDTELAAYAVAAGSFREAGIAVCVSSPETVHIGGDKKTTNAWLRANGFPCVRQASPQQVLSQRGQWQLPVIAKPVGGSASIGIRVIKEWSELESLASGDSGYVVEEIARGREFTINVYVSKRGKCIAAVPHWRVEVRAGEVSKGVTRKNPELMSLGRRIAEALPGAWGPLNIQCFLDGDGTIRVFEINARFGGGYPLAHHAGAQFTSWLLDEIEGRELQPYDAWEDNLAMLRFDDAVYLSGVEIGLGEDR